MREIAHRVQGDAHRDGQQTADQPYGTGGRSLRRLRRRHHQVVVGSRCSSVRTRADGGGQVVEVGLLELEDRQAAVRGDGISTAVARMVSGGEAFQRRDADRGDGAPYGGQHVVPFDVSIGGDLVSDLPREQ